MVVQMVGQIVVQVQNAVSQSESVEFSPKSPRTTGMTRESVVNVGI